MSANSASDQASYRAGYDAGFRAGYEAGSRAAAVNSSLPQINNNNERQQSAAATLPLRPPPIPARPQASPIWQPKVGTTWQYVLSHPVELQNAKYPISQAAVWIIDLFETSASTVAALKAQNRKVVAYFSAGSFEDWRPDASAFSKSDMGKALDGWEGEKWLQTNSAGVREILKRRMDLAVQKGFDGIDPDNVDGYDNKNGLGLKKRDTVDLVLFLAKEAHARGLSVGLKNAGDIVPDVVDHVEYCVQEQAVEFDDIEAFDLFLRKGKPIFHVEYPKGDDPDNKKQNDEKRVEGRKRDKALCQQRNGWSSIIKNVKLDQWIQTD